MLLKVIKDEGTSCTISKQEIHNTYVKSLETNKKITYLKYNKNTNS